MPSIFNKLRKKKCFNFMELPAELKIKIVYLAVSIPSSKELMRPFTRENFYTTARSLALVSRITREIVMPFLLDTVILDSQDSISRLVNSVRLQKKMATNPRFATHCHYPFKVDYPKRVKAIWASRCPEPLPGHVWGEYQDPEYRVLYECFANAKTLGLNFNALHLLYEVLGMSTHEQQLPGWKPKRVVLAGDLIRWNTLTQSVVGQLFLGSITHLTIWVGERREELSIDNAAVANWINAVPFKNMDNLTHFAFTLIRAQEQADFPLMVFILPGQNGSKFRTWEEAGYRKPMNATVFLDWAWEFSEKGTVFGWILWWSFDPSAAGDVRPDLWEMAFARGEHDKYWKNTKADAGRAGSGSQGQELVQHHRH
ncbi:hypothetical protein GALMADRAFT_1359981 [Galerina marginata CBS 339.88]|uniref:F-box domain-containing protein n=1 Tax=Galerina marginata (strain CBS 339.88) TaxID=685588 RepID=A0A067S975_GALM3|nr:hypothetical protein GALMADRAFT_1359981 [Galerina marginata CBS 339.88]